MICRGRSIVGGHNERVGLKQKWTIRNIKHKDRAYLSQELRFGGWCLVFGYWCFRKDGIVTAFQCTSERDGKSVGAPGCLFL